MSGYHREPPDTYHLLLLYNCYLTKKKSEEAAQMTRSNVERALQIEEKGWPKCLRDLRFCQMREVGIPWRAGYDPEARVPQVLFNILVLCYGECSLYEQDPEPCHEDYSKKFPHRDGLQQSSLTLVCSGHHLWDIFSHWRPGKVESLGILEFKMPAFDAVREAFAKAARVMDQEVKLQIQRVNEDVPMPSSSSRHNKGNSKGKPQEDRPQVLVTNTKFDKEHHASVQTLRHCQRFDSVGPLGSADEMPLSHYPLHMAFCHASEFIYIHDDCKDQSRKRKLPQMLENACKCGELTWKIRRIADDTCTVTYPKDHVIPHFLHGYKEECMQRFFRGSVVIYAIADIPELTDEDHPRKGSIVFIREKHSSSSMCDSLRHHMCFIISMEAAHHVSESWGNVDLNRHQPTDLFREDVLRQGHFNMVAGWEGAGKKSLSFTQ